MVTEKEKEEKESSYDYMDIYPFPMMLMKNVYFFFKSTFCKHGIYMIKVRQKRDLLFENDIFFVLLF